VTTGYRLIALDAKTALESRASAKTARSISKAGVVHGTDQQIDLEKGDADSTRLRL